MSKVKEFFLLNKIYFGLVLLFVVGIISGVALIVYNNTSMASKTPNDPYEVHCTDYSAMMMIDNDSFERVEVVDDSGTYVNYYLKDLGVTNGEFYFSDTLVFDEGSYIDFSYNPDGSKNKLESISLCLASTDALYSSGLQHNVVVANNFLIKSVADEKVNANFILDDYNSIEVYEYVFAGINFSTNSNAHENTKFYLYDKLSLEMDTVIYENNDTSIKEFPNDSKSIDNLIVFETSQYYNMNIDIINSTINYYGDIISYDQGYDRENRFNYESEIDSINFSNSDIKGNIKVSGTEVLVDTINYEGIMDFDGGDYNDLVIIDSKLTSNFNQTVLYVYDYNTTIINSEFFNSGDFHYTVDPASVTDPSNYDLDYINISVIGGTKADSAVQIINSNILIENSTFRDNFATQSGGAIDLFNSYGTIIGSNFTNNESTIGGAIRVWDSSNINLYSNYFTKNRSVGMAGGGALSVGPDAYVTLENNIMECNEALLFGGAISIQEGTAVMNSGSIINNVATGHSSMQVALGGGVYVGASLYSSGIGEFRFNGGNIENNVAGSGYFVGLGGGIYSSPQYEEGYGVIEVDPNAGGYVYLSGDPIVKNNAGYIPGVGNYTDNLHISSSKYITLSGALETGADIGIVTETQHDGVSNLFIGQGDFNYTISNDDLNYIKSDLGFNIELIDEKLYLTTANPSFVPSLGYDSSMVCPTSTEVVHTLLFDASGGSFATEFLSTVDNGVISEPSDIPTRSGYTFYGWYDDIDHTTRHDFSAPMTSSKVVFARWIKSLVDVTVSFSANGGINPPDSVTILEGNKISVPNVEPTRENYNFTGWYINSSATSKYNFPNPVNRNIVLYAGWERIYRNFDVSFDANGGDNAPVSVVVVEEQLLIKPTVVPNKDGYKFNGWYTDDESNNLYNFTEPVLGPITLYAGWLELYDVTYETNGGSSIESTVVSEEDYIIEPSSPYREGYNFNGWYADSKFTERFDFTSLVTSDTTIYADWAKIPIYYNVVFDVNEGKGDYADYRVLENSKIVSPSLNPTRSGYEFTGWYRDVSCSILFDFDLDKVNNSVTLYAGWKKVIIEPDDDSDIDEETVEDIIYTVKFDLNGADGEIDTQFIIDGELVIEPSVPIKEGFEFVGWYTDYNMLNEFNFDNDVIEESIVLYAKWEDEKIIVSFDSFDGDNNPISQSVYKNSYIEEPEEPTLEGYDFAGWYLDEEYTIKFSFTNRVGGESITLYAKWVPIDDVEDSSIIILNILFASITVLLTFIGIFAFVNYKDVIKWLLIFVPLILSTLLFVLTQSLDGSWIIFDEFTLFFGAITIVQMLLMIMYVRNRSKKVS